MYANKTIISISTTKARKRVSKDRLLFLNHQLPVEETQRHVSKPVANRIRFRKVRYTNN